MQGFIYLQWLDVSRNRLQSLHGLSSLLSLVELRVANNLIVSLDGLQSLMNLGLLDVSGNKLGDLRELLRLKQNPNLRELGLRGNPLAEGKA
jgi:Leucine-rich repeat (LRR) protein